MGGRPSTDGSPKSGASPERGTVAVIVTAFRRKEFLAEAVASVQRQTFPQDKVELCIVSDFPSEAVARADGFARVVRIQPNGTDQGPWIASAMDAVRADLLCFLDDDDRFAPNKIATVSARFEEDPQLGFLRNGLSFFGPASRSDEGPASRFAGLQEAYVPGSDRTYGSIARLWAMGAAFNQSSMSIRRELLSRHRAALEHVRGGCPGFVFFAAVASRLAIRIEPRPLTEYRCHAGNESPSAARSRSEWWSRSFRLAETRAHDAEVMIRMLESEGGGEIAPLLHRALAQNLLLSRLADPRPERRAILRAARKLLRSSGRREWWSDRGLLLAALVASSIAPSFARFLAGRPTATR